MSRNNNDLEFYKRIEQQYKDKLPFVVYRGPESTTVNFFAQNNEQLHYTNDYQESGFIFAPFDNKEGTILFPKEESSLYSIEFLKEYLTEDAYNFLPKNSDTAKKEHISLVEKGIGFLKANSYKKVVLSRKEDVSIQNFKFLESFKKMLVNYTNAFVYCWFHPKVGLWLGATPETLLKVEKHTFSTMALASTQVFDKSKHVISDASNCLNVKWKSKEIAEQQYVTDFILEQLDTAVKVSEPYTTKAGNLLHLCTDISGKLSKQLTLKIIVNLLHPTPAVCGVPKNKAQEFILQNENYNRQYYTGFLGELNLNNTTNLFVNLRCMQVFEKGICIYVGGGITKDSNPESEWRETVEKSKTIQRVLR